MVATLEFLEHHFAKMGHTGLPPVPHTLNRPQNYSIANTAATAAPAASFSPLIREVIHLSGETGSLDNYRSNAEFKLTQYQSLLELILGASKPEDSWRTISLHSL
jgi:hypothetical protein